MNHAKLKILSKTNKKFPVLVLECEDTINFLAFVINILLKSLEQLKVLLIKTNFKSELEEIKFFKEIKPLLFSKLICQITELVQFI